MTSLASLVVAIFLLPLNPVSPSPDAECVNISEKGRYFTLSVDRKIDQESGDWIRTYSAQNTVSDNPSDDIVLEATHSNAECRGKNVIRLKVVVRELKRDVPSRDEGKNVLTFHKRYGTNVILLEDGRTAQKLNAGDPYNAVLFTNRPLRNNEIFQIILEKKAKKTNHALGIGVVSFSPDDVEVLPQMHVRNQTWIMHHNTIFHSNSAIKTNYGRSLDTLEVSDRVGVMRRDDGELHFFINDVDQGSAGVVPESVYGLLELWHDANRARIVH